jgi:hypothetical protein
MLYALPCRTSHPFRSPLFDDIREEQAKFYRHNTEQGVAYRVQMEHFM